MHAKQQQPGARWTRRGFSFLEAVLAAALLGIIASAIFSVLSYVYASDREDTVRLGAAEVANRIIITYLDDKTSIKKLPDLIDYGPDSYRWDLEEDTVRIEEPNRHLRVTAGREGAVPNALVRLDEIRVTVIATGFERSGVARRVLERIPRTNERSTPAAGSLFTPRPSESVTANTETRSSADVKSQPLPSINNDDLDVPTFLRNRR